jgi:hypothetical protein
MHSARRKLGCYSLDIRAVVRAWAKLTLILMIFYKTARFVKILNETTCVSDGWLHICHFCFEELARHI